MNVTLYGTRCSIAVANNDTKKHGGNTTCMYVETKTGVPIIIDAGTGIRKLGFDLLQKKKQHLNLIFTHYHWDHIQGFPFFAPLFFKNIKIDIYGSKKETTARKALNYQMNRPYFPATMDELFATISFKELKKKMRLGGVEIQYLPTNHPNYTLGLKFTEGNKRFVFLTDNELKAVDGNTRYEKFVEFIKGVEFFIHDAQYTDEIYKKRIGWGHSTYRQVMQLAQDAGVKKVVLTHHDHGSTDAFINAQIKEISTQFSDIDIQAAADGNTFKL